MTKITKNNICEVIENHLKSEKIRFDISNNDSRGCLYELFISSTSGFIQVEYNLENESNDYVCIQLFTDIDNSGLSIYHSDWDNECKNCDSIEGEIYNLIESAKRINQGISKIQAKINQIKDICEEYELEFEDFISLNFNFD